MEHFLNLQIEKKYLVDSGYWAQRLNDTKNFPLTLKIFRRGMSEQFKAVTSPYKEVQKRVRRHKSNRIYLQTLMNPIKY
jgi:hypothetical protein